MEKQSNEERLLRRLIREAGVEKPSANFKDKIMLAIEGKKAVPNSYQPLISPTAWAISLVVLVLATGVLFWFYGVPADLSANLNVAKLFKFPPVQLPALHLSRTMQYAIAFIALFFIQVPFLRKLIIRGN